MAESEPSRFAHFESVKVHNIYGLYMRHAEVARDIHQNTLRQFTGNDDLTVDLVRESPIIPKSGEVLEALEKYDVVSVSSGVGMGAILYSSGIAGNDLVGAYKSKFAEDDMPIYIVSAGNEGKTRQVVVPRVADFARNSLVVGEANNSNGESFVEDHSSRNNPTLTSDSPFNRGEKYQFYDVSPSLEGHEDLIKDWIIENEIAAEFQRFKEENKGQELNDSEMAAAYRAIRGAKNLQYNETNEGQAWIKEQVAAYITNPEKLHTQIMSEFRKEKDIDENGYVMGLDGTSFSAPEQAGYISGALYEQEQRENQNLPILTKDEITTLAKMATLDTTIREGETGPMYSHQNADGHEFVAGGGHGVFNPEMFRALLDESYKKIGTDPDIDRTPIVATMRAEIPEGHNGTKPVTLNSNLPEGTNIIIDRVRLDTQQNVVGTVPHFAVIEKPNGESNITRLQEANSLSTFLGWSRMEHEFGEELPSGENWKIHLHDGHDATLEDAQITIYGYNKGGLMDQMIDYSKELALKMAPKPETEVTPETVTPQLEGVDNNDSAILPGPR